MNYEGYFNYDINEKSLNDSIRNIEIKLNDIIKIIKVPKEGIPSEAYEFLNLNYLKIQKNYLIIDIKQLKNFIGDLNNFTAQMASHLIMSNSSLILLSKTLFIQIWK